MAKFRIKRFSLASGRFDGKRNTVGSTIAVHSGILGAFGAGLGVIGGGKGALIGGGLGAITGLLTTALARSEFNKKSTPNITTNKLFAAFSKNIEEINKLNSSSSFNFNLENYEIGAKNPELFDLNVKANEDSIALMIRELNREEEIQVNELLDAYCATRRNNDYTAEHLDKGGWMVTVSLVDYKEASELLVDFMAECHFRINFVV